MPANPHFGAVHTVALQPYAWPLRLHGPIAVRRGYAQVRKTGVGEGGAGFGMAIYRRERLLQQTRGAASQTPRAWTAILVGVFPAKTGVSNDVVRYVVDLLGGVDLVLNPERGQYYLCTMIDDVASAEWFAPESPQMAGGFAMAPVGATISSVRDWPERLVALKYLAATTTRVPNIILRSGLGAMLYGKTEE